MAGNPGRDWHVKDTGASQRNMARRLLSLPAAPETSARVSALARPLKEIFDIPSRCLNIPATKTDSPGKPAGSIPGWALESAMEEEVTV